MTAFNLTDDQIERYSRQLILKEIGGSGQEKLLSSKVLIVGAGGLGSPAALYLAAAGVGEIALVDSDSVELNNLQRQVLHTTANVGKPKAISGAEALKALNPDVNVTPLQMRLTSKNVLEVIKPYDAVLDGSDNFPTRYLMNDACVLSKKPLFHAAILRFDGQVMTILPGKGPCFRCLFPEPPPPDAVPTCQQAGILGSVAGVMGTLVANEVLKFILGLSAGPSASLRAGSRGELLQAEQSRGLVGRMLIFDGLSSRFREVTITRNPQCPVCGDTPTLRELIDYEEFCALRPHK